MTEPKGYRRVLIKLSGEALAPPGHGGVDDGALAAMASEIEPLVRAGVQVGLVIGAGNFIRGRQLSGAKNIHRTTADYMGMLATIMNAIALRDALQAAGVGAEVASAIPVPLVCESYFRPRVMDALAAGKVVIFAGGTSHPGVTTDMCAAIRASDIDADVLLKATKVDGVYDSDPAKNPNAKRYDRLTYEQAIAEKLGVMDLPAMAFCMDRAIPIEVFNMSVAGNLQNACAGQTVGTIITNE